MRAVVVDSALLAALGLPVHPGEESALLLPRRCRARAFAIGFYGALGDRESIVGAYRQGCAAISLEGLGDRDRPQLAVCTGIDAITELDALSRPCASGPNRSPARPGDRV